MGNLRDKYTDEEWEDLGKKLKKEVAKFGNEVKNYTRDRLDEENLFNDKWMNVVFGNKKINISLPPRPLDRVLVEEIDKLVETTSNDQELGAKIRSLINS